MIKTYLYLAWVFLLTEVAHAGSVFSMGEPIYNYVNAEHTTEISLYFALESGLPANNYMVIGLPVDLGTNSITITAAAWTDAP